MRLARRNSESRGWLRRLCGDRRCLNSENFGGGVISTGGEMTDKAPRVFLIYPLFAKPTIIVTFIKRKSLLPNGTQALEIQI